MKIQMLISAVGQDIMTLPERMGVKTDAVIINQTDHFAYTEREIDGCRIQFFENAERGVGRSRNQALLHADADIVLFSDEDIRYEPDYAQKIEKAFSEHPEADILLFHVDVCDSRRTYENTKFRRVRKFNCGRYPAYSAACRLKKLQNSGVSFSLLFGGGAPYSNGEDSLFFMDCLRKGLCLYAVPEKIGAEEERESTWFHGYTEKFFYDRGYLYHYLYRGLAGIYALQFILRKKSWMCKEIPAGKAYALMKKGIREAAKG